MKITLEINEVVWNYDLAKYNAQKALEAQNASIFAQRRGEPFSPGPSFGFVPLTLEQYVAKILADKEAAIAADQAKQHDAAILAATPEDKARVAKILAQPEQVKDAIRAQVDAL